MKRHSKVKILLTLFFCSIFIVLLNCLKVAAKTITVYTTSGLKKALKNDDYDVIFIYPGTYFGNFKLERDNVILKAKDGEVILTQSVTSRPLFYISGDNIKIEGITFKCKKESKNFCIVIEDSKKLEFRKNQVVADYGMYIKHSKGTLYRNVFKVWNLALRLIDTKDMDITYNHFIDINRKDKKAWAFIEILKDFNLLNISNNWFKSKTFKLGGIDIFNIKRGSIIYVSSNFFVNIYYLIGIWGKNSEFNIFLKNNQNNFPPATYVQIYDFNPDKFNTNIFLTSSSSDFHNLLYFYNHIVDKKAKSFYEEIKTQLDYIFKIKTKLESLNITFKIFKNEEDYEEFLIKSEKQLNEALYEGNIEKALNLIVNRAFVPLSYNSLLKCSIFKSFTYLPLSDNLQILEKYGYFDTCNRFYSQSPQSFFGPLYPEVGDKIIINGKPYIDYIPEAPKDLNSGCKIFESHIQSYYQWIKNLYKGIRDLTNLLKTDKVISNTNLFEKILKIKLILEKNKRNLGIAYKTYLFDFPVGILLLDYEATLTKIKKSFSNPYQSLYFKQIGYGFASLGWIKNKLFQGSSQSSETFQHVMDEFKKIVCLKYEKNLLGKYSVRDLCDSNCEPGDKECNERKKWWNEGFLRNFNTIPACWIEKIEEFIQNF